MAIMGAKQQRLFTAIAVLGALGVVSFALVSAFPSAVEPAIGESDRGSAAVSNATATVTIRAEDSNRSLAKVEARLAETDEQRYTGLSNTPTLHNGTGMLFVYDAEAPRTFVMREMDYPLDIVFVGADGQINAIRQAPSPGPNQTGDEIRRSGSAKWVLEVPHGWMAAQNVSAGDRIIIDQPSS